MFGILINMATALVALAVIWQGSKLALKLAVWAVETLLAIILQAPAAYAAAKAERTLPARDFAFDFEGDEAQARAFSAIVDDRLVRTRLAHQLPQATYLATRIGRRLAGS